MATETKLKAGRSWEVNAGGISSLEREYVVILDAVTGANAESANIPGVPAVGSAHPVNTNLVVSGYRVSEGSSADKRTLRVTVKYAPIETQTESPSAEEERGDEITYSITEWGWDSSTSEKELITDVDNNPVVNSAGDPFERVPNISVPTPVFTKVFKTKKRIPGYVEYNCKVNDVQVTIGGMVCPEGTLLCSVAEKRLLDDKQWNYEYTVQLKYKANLVCLERAEFTTNIGWDVSIVDAGMRAFNQAHDGKLELIRMTDKETGKLCTVTSPALLDGTGHAFSDTDPNPTPYNFRFKAYARAPIPALFYSEPPIVETED